MHPILANKERLILYLTGWLLLACLLASVAVLSGSLQWLAALALMIPVAIVYAFICLSALYVCRAFPLQVTAYPKLITVYVAASSLSSALWLLIIKGWAILLSQFEATRDIDAKFGAIAPVAFGGGVLLFLLAVVVHYLILAFESSREAERQSLEMKTLAREAELKALKTQIHPHFLFNSLHAISALTTMDPAAAREMSLRLADFLRKTLKLAATQLITVTEELSLIDDYLAIERARFGPRLNFSKEVDEQALSCKVPALLLQPLVENAIKHGVTNAVEGGAIRLEICQQGSRLSLTVVNTCDPDSMPQSANGVGLKNVSGRLATLYGNEARLDIAKSDTQFKAQVSLPASS